MLHTRKVQNWVTMSFIIGALIASQRWHFEFSPGSNKMSHSKSLGPSQETYKETTKTKTSSFGEQ